MRGLSKYYSGDQLEKNEMGGRCSAYGGEKGAYRVLVGKPEGKRVLGRPERCWDEDIKGDVQEGFGAWTGLIWLRIGTGGGYL